MNIFWLYHISWIGDVIVANSSKWDSVDRERCRHMRGLEASETPAQAERVVSAKNIDRFGIH